MQEAMVFSENKLIKQIVSGLSWVLIASGGMSFWIGGRALHEFAGIDRAIAEVEGLAGAAVLYRTGCRIESSGRSATHNAISSY